MGASLSRHPDNSRLEGQKARPKRTHFTKAQLRKAARECLDGDDEPMHVLEQAPANTETIPIKGGWRLVEHRPARLGVTELRPPGSGPWKTIGIPTLQA